MAAEIREFNFAGYLCPICNETTVEIFEEGTVNQMYKLQDDLIEIIFHRASETRQRVHNKCLKALEVAERLKGNVIH